MTARPEQKYVDHVHDDAEVWAGVGLSGAAMFGPNHEVLQPSEVLYKKAVLVERGSFRPPTHVNFDMLHCALEKFTADPDVAGKPVLPLFELTSVVGA